MNRLDISRLQKDRSIYMKIGMLCSLSFVILCFSFTIYPEEPFLGNSAYLPTEEIEVIRTKQEKKKQLPPLKIDISKAKMDLANEPEFIDKLPSDPIARLDHNLHKQIAFKPVLTRPAFSKIILPKPVLPPDPVEKIYKDDLVIIAEEMPRFPGCEEKEMQKEEKFQCSVRALLQYMGSNIRYPSIAKSNGVQGTVILSFVVELDGSISSIEIVRDIGAGCGREAVRVVKTMPNWSPGKQRGRPVRVKYSLPVKFTILD